VATMPDPVVPDDSTMPDHRPAPDYAKLAGQFAEWIRGETLVGRMLANLKTGRLPEVLAAEEDGPRAELVAALSVHWNGWERGSIVPLEVAEGLRDAGLEAFLADPIER
jgi:hypothetical protein